MKEISKTILTRISLCLLLVIPLLSAGMSPAVTARVALSQAQILAKRWQTDAALVAILSPDVDVNGVSGAHYAASWVYTFVSPRKSDKAFMISVNSVAGTSAASRTPPDKSYLFYVGPDFGLTGSEQVSAVVEPGSQALPDQFLDSDKAIAAAKVAGYRAVPPVNMRLSKGAGKPAVWRIGEFEIDAVSGKAMK
jgi:hypothetical protein